MRTLHLTGAYGDGAAAERFAERWKAAGKRLDMGKSCVRFRRLDDVPLDVVGDAIAATSVAGLVELYERSRTAAR